MDVRTVGAGGGSIAFVPELTKALRVGPESAGAVPGPACYMKGGEQPTVCDANVVLGYLPSDVQLGGKMEINREASVAAAWLPVCRGFSPVPPWLALVGAAGVDMRLPFGGGGARPPHAR